jgi:eukaryotic-like serine/threonine-protein kinase
MPIQPAPNVVIAQRFRLNRLIGRGGMGSVWYATHLGLDVPCAVKFIEGEGSQFPEAHARFEREAKAAAQLRSPHVVQILDHGVCDGTPYIAMELLDGEDLGKRLTRLGRLPPNELYWIITQVGRALTKAHAQGIVHRDLKPDNIFIVPDDDREIAKVLDFGIAKASGSGTPGASTRTGAMLGTPYYMSPEQAQGTRAVDSRSDLWSLAVIVFEALTGHRPFESEALGDLLMKIIVAPVPLPSQFAGDLPAGVDGWWVRASQRDPAQRFQTAKEFCDSLALAFGRSSSDLGDPLAPAMSTPMGAARSPVYAPTPQPHRGVSTGAPIAQTFDVRGPGRRRTGIVVAIGGGLLLLGVGVGVSFVVKGKGAAAAAPVEATTGSVRPVRDAMTIEPPAEVAKLPEPAAPVTTLVEPPVVRPVPVAKTPPAAKPSPPARPQPVAKPAPPTGLPPTTPPPPPPPEEKKKPIDLGI